jgi:transketolase
MIEEMSKETKLFVSVEEHSTIGGLGSAISEIKSTLENTPRQLFIGVPDQYKFSGSYKYLKEKYGLEAKSIANKILNSYKE